MAEFEHLSGSDTHSRVLWKMQGVVKRPDGTFVRPEVNIPDPMTLGERDLTDAVLLQSLLQGYDSVEESALIKAWVEQITVSAQSSVRELK